MSFIQKKKKEKEKKKRINLLWSVGNMYIKGNRTKLIKQLHGVFKDKFIFVLVQALFSTFLCLHTSDFGGCPFIINKWW